MFAVPVTPRAAQLSASPARRAGGRWQRKLFISSNSGSSLMIKINRETSCGINPFTNLGMRDAAAAASWHGSTVGTSRNGTKSSRNLRVVSLGRGSEEPALGLAARTSPYKSWHDAAHQGSTPSCPTLPYLKGAAGPCRASTSSIQISEAPDSSPSGQEQQRRRCQ